MGNSAVLLAILVVASVGSALLFLLVNTMVGVILNRKRSVLLVAFFGCLYATGVIFFLLGSYSTEQSFYKKFSRDVKVEDLSQKKRSFEAGIRIFYNKREKINKIELKEGTTCPEEN